MPRLTIFYIYFHDVDFVPIHVDEVICELARRGHRVHLFTSIRNAADNLRLRRANICLHNVRTLRARFISELLFMVFLLPLVCWWVLRCRPHIIYCRHGASNLVALLAARLFQTPCFFEVNDIVVDKLQFTKASWVKKAWTEFYHAFSLRYADGILAVTSQIAEWLRERYAIDPAKIMTVPNGVNIARFQPRSMESSRERYGLPRDCRVILSLGSLFPWAGMEILVQAAAKVLAAHPNCVFAVGSAEQPYLGELQQMVRSAGLDKYFRFFGFIPWEDASHFISTADLCVAPFVLKDTRSGIASLRVLAYLACGKPVVGSDICGLGDWLERESVGFSSPMGCSASMARVLVTALNDGKLLRQMGQRGRVLTVSGYSWQSIVDRLVHLFQRHYLASGRSAGNENEDLPLR